MATKKTIKKTVKKAAKKSYTWTDAAKMMLQYVEDEEGLEFFDCDTGMFGADNYAGGPISYTVNDDGDPDAKWSDAEEFLTGDDSIFRFIDRYAGLCSNDFDKYKCIIADRFSKFEGLGADTPDKLVKNIKNRLKKDTRDHSVEIKGLKRTLREAEENVEYIKRRIKELGGTLDD